jgi:hypothetical protein
MTKNIEGFVSMVNEAKNARKSWEEILEIVNKSGILGAQYSISGIRNLFAREKDKFLDGRPKIIRELRESGKTWDEVGASASLLGICRADGSAYSGGGIQSLYHRLTGVKSVPVDGKKKVVKKAVEPRAINSEAAKRWAETMKKEDPVSVKVPPVAKKEEVQKIYVLKVFGTGLSLEEIRQVSHLLYGYDLGLFIKCEENGIRRNLNDDEMFELM